MAKWTKYYKVIKPKPSTLPMVDSQELVDPGMYTNVSWYQRLVQGSASRMTKYREYDLMDGDVEVSRALDTIAEEVVGNDFKTQEPFKIIYTISEQVQINDSVAIVLREALKRWVKIQDLENRRFNIARTVIKYGDAFFRRKHPADKWQFIHPKNVVAALVDEQDATKVIAWQIRKGTKKPRSSGYSVPLGANTLVPGETEIVHASEIVRFTLNDDMSDTAPFGESILRPVYRTFKQKELLEDAIIIYRVQRAPERRVFYIDVGNMPPPRAKKYLEQLKNELRQKRVPTFMGGQNEIDATYNPQSMVEDFFFAVRTNESGTRVETLPGGQNLGEVSDLEYFQRKLWRGLRVPASYMIEQQEGGQLWNDGKVGIAYIQELRFALFVTRIQQALERTFDEEFKKYLRVCDIQIDPTIFKIELPEPSNFGRYRQLELDSAILNAYSSADGINYLSKRFIMKKYLQMTDEEILINEKLRREELGLKEDKGEEDYPLIYGIKEPNFEENELGLGGGGGPPLGAPPTPEEELQGGVGGIEPEAGGEGIEGGEEEAVEI